MSSLHETQGAFRAVVTGSDATALLAKLRCPAEPAARLGIYRRHYRESFRRHLRGRYPTLEWLIGTDRLVEVADATLRRMPPRAPSLAEYGRELIDLLGDARWSLPPYVAEVALLDWTLGGLSVASEAPPLPISALAVIASERLGDMSLGLQPGLSLIDCDWPVDELVHLRQAGDAPEALRFQPRATRLELRGARGRFSLRRLAAADFAFRSRLMHGESLGTAAEAALAKEPAFDLAAALAALFAEGLVISHSGDDTHA